MTEKIMLLCFNPVLGIKNKRDFWYVDNHGEIRNNIVKLSKQATDAMVILNKSPRESSRSYYVPPRFLKTIESYPIQSFLKELKCPAQVLKWDNTSISLNAHVLKSLEGYQKVYLCGFHGVIDILPSCLSLIDFYKSIRVKPRTFGDVSDNIHRNCLGVLSALNILEQQ